MWNLLQNPIRFRLDRPSSLEHSKSIGGKTFMTDQMYSIPIISSPIVHKTEAITDSFRSVPDHVAVSVANTPFSNWRSYCRLFCAVIKSSRVARKLISNSKLTSFSSEPTVSVSALNRDRESLFTHLLLYFYRLYYTMSLIVVLWLLFALNVKKKIISLKQ